VKRNCSVPPTLTVDLVEALQGLPFVEWHTRIIPNDILGLRIEKDQILNVSVCRPVEIFWITLNSCNVVSKIFDTKNFIHYDFNIVSNFIIDVEIDGGLI
jgi:hypothetical protein